jgi:rubrerythrin
MESAPKTPDGKAWTATDVLGALELALQAERRGHAFYAGIAATTHNVRLKRMADEFASEEAEHVAELEKWIDRVAAAE